MKTPHRPALLQNWRFDFGLIQRHLANFFAANVGSVAVRDYLPIDMHLLYSNKMISTGLRRKLKINGWHDFESYSQ